MIHAGLDDPLVMLANDETFDALMFARYTKQEDSPRARHFEKVRITVELVED